MLGGSISPHHFLLPPDSKFPLMPDRAGILLFGPHRTFLGRTPLGPWMPWRCSGAGAAKDLVGTEGSGFEEVRVWTDFPTR